MLKYLDLQLKAVMLCAANASHGCFPMNALQTERQGEGE